MFLRDNKDELNKVKGIVLVRERKREGERAKLKELKRGNYVSIFEFRVLSSVFNLNRNLGQSSLGSDYFPFLFLFRSYYI